MYNVLFHHEFWSDEVTEFLDDTGLLFYVGLWTCAERSAVFEVKFGELRKKIFPGRPIPIPQLEAYYQALRIKGKIFEYRKSGKRLAWIQAYHKRQRIDNPPAPILPLPEWVLYMDFNEPGTAKPKRSKFKYVVLPYDFSVDPPRRPPDAELARHVAAVKAEVLKKGGKSDG